MRHWRPLSTLVLLKHLSVNVSVPAGEPLRSAPSGVAAQLSVTSLISNTHSVCASISERVCVCVCFWRGVNIIDEGTRGPNEYGGHAFPKTCQSDHVNPPTRAPLFVYYLAHLINYFVGSGIKRASCRVYFAFFFKFYYKKPWSELVFLYITTITVPVAAKLCGLITMALLPCDTLGMTKPSRESDREGRASNLSVATDTQVSQPN